MILLFFTVHTIYTELPGVGKDKLSVELDGNILIIEAEKVNPVELKEGEDWVARLRERGHGKIRRSFRLPSYVDTNSVNTCYVDGLLKIHLNKSSTTKKLQIE